MKQVASSLKIELANYNELLAFSQFGSDLDKETKDVLTLFGITPEELTEAGATYEEVLVLKRHM